MRQWEGNLSGWCETFGVTLPPSLEPTHFYYWDSNGRLNSNQTQIPADSRVEALDDVQRARFQALLLVARSPQDNGPIQLLFKHHSEWDLVLPSPGIPTPPRDIRGIIGEVQRNRPALFRTAAITDVIPYGGLFSFKKSPTNGEPNLYFFPFFVIRATIGQHGDKAFDFEERKHEYLSKRELEAAGKYCTPNGDVCRALDLVFPGWSALSRYRFEFDYAVSFAAEQRSLVESLVRAMQAEAPSVRIFYDFDHDLQGASLPHELYSVYYRRARFTLVFMSKEYREKEWPRHELTAALHRLIQERGNEYILPFTTDGTVIEELATLGRCRVTVDNLDEHARRLARRVQGH